MKAYVSSKTYGINVYIFVEWYTINISGGMVKCLKCHAATCEVGSHMDECKTWMDVLMARVSYSLLIRVTILGQHFI